MRHIKPTNHDEMHINRGIVLLILRKDKKVVNEQVFNAKNITFNDVYVSFIDKEGISHCLEIGEKELRIYPFADEEMVKGFVKEEQIKDISERQITFFDLLEEE